MKLSELPLNELFIWKAHLEFKIDQNVKDRVEAAIGSSESLKKHLVAVRDIRIIQFTDIKFEIEKRFNEIEFTQTL